MTAWYLPDGCTQEDVDRAAGGYDEGYYCNWCEERVDDEHECPGNEPEYYADKLDDDDTDMEEVDALYPPDRWHEGEE